MLDVLVSCSSLAHEESNGQNHAHINEEVLKIAEEGILSQYKYNGGELNDGVEGHELEAVE